jgi:hypothetical protein
MPRMLKELESADRGLLGAFARDASAGHAPAWRLCNRDAAGTGDVGIFHETYLVPRPGHRDGTDPGPGRGVGLGSGEPGLGSGEPGEAPLNRAVPARSGAAGRMGS